MNYIDEQLSSAINADSPTVDAFTSQNYGLFDRIRGSANASEAIRADLRSAALNRYNAKLQRELRQTSYQDTVASMKAAGLNPILAFQQGEATTPNISTSSASQGSANASGSAALAGTVISAAALLAKIGIAIASAA